MSKLMIALTAVLLVVATHSAMAQQQYRDSRFGTPFRVYGGHGTNDDIYVYRPEARTDRAKRRQIERAERAERASPKRKDTARSSSGAPKAVTSAAEPTQAVEAKAEPQAIQKPVTTGSTTSQPANEPIQNASQKTCKQYFAQIGMTVSVPCSE